MLNGVAYEPTYNQACSSLAETEVRPNWEDANFVVTTTIAQDLDYCSITCNNNINCNGFVVATAHARVAVPDNTNVMRILCAFHIWPVTGQCTPVDNVNFEFYRKSGASATSATSATSERLVGISFLPNSGDVGSGESNSTGNSNATNSTDG